MHIPLNFYFFALFLSRFDTYLSLSLVKECMGYFRAMQQREEYHTSRALELTGDLIQLNPANYTAWQYRRLCLLAQQQQQQQPIPSSSFSTSSSTLFDTELTFIQRIADQFGAKNYQLWAHRREIVRWIYEQASNPVTTTVTTTSSLFPPRTDGEVTTTINNHQQWKNELLRKELGFTVRYLMQDIKNYHVWGQRQWLLQLFLFDNQQNENISTSSTVLENEFDFTENLLLGNDDSDIRNNSVWNHRWFLFTRGINYSRISNGTTVLPPTNYLTLSQIEKEIDFLLTCLNIVQKNEAAWSYLRGLVRLPYIDAPSTGIAVPSNPGSSSSVGGMTMINPFFLPNYPLHRWTKIVNFCKKCQNYSQPGINIFANEWLAEVAEEELAYYYHSTKLATAASGTLSPSVVVASETSTVISLTNTSSSSSSFSISTYSLLFTNKEDAYTSMVQLYTLNSEHDIIRKKYWLHRIHQATQRVSF